jgi:hypothetical protein
MAIPWLHAPSRLDRDAILDMQVAGQSEPVYERASARSGAPEA